MYPALAGQWSINFKRKSTRSFANEPVAVERYNTDLWSHSYLEHGRVKPKEFLHLLDSNTSQLWYRLMEATDEGGDVSTIVLFRLLLLLGLVGFRWKKDQSEFSEERSLRDLAKKPSVFVGFPFKEDPVRLPSEFLGFPIENEAISFMRWQGLDPSFWCVAFSSSLAAPLLVTMSPPGCGRHL